MEPDFIFLFIVASALFGAIAGSFLNALSFRFNTGRGFFSPAGMGGRSKCMRCGHPLKAADLVPVFSFIFLRGKCRYCSSKISWQYPLVEALAALLSVGVYLQNPTPVLFALWFLIWMTLLFISIYDLKHTLIPWRCSILLGVLAFASLFAGQAPALWSFLSGPILALPLFLLSLVSRGRWMGWGDSALELSLGWLLGLSAGFTALCLAFWSGALVGVGIILFERLPRAKKQSVTIGMKSEVPFAPFLVFGAALAYFFHVDFFSSLTLF